MTRLWTNYININALVGKLVFQIQLIDKSEDSLDKEEMFLTINTSLRNELLNINGHNERNTTLTY